MNPETRKPLRPLVERLFFAIWPAASAAKTLHDVAGACARNCGGRAMRVDTLHLTLAFLGSIAVQRIPAVMKVADRVDGAAFPMTLDRLGYWRHNRILWAGGESVALVALADRLSVGLKSAGFQLDARAFVPHMTLLRDADCTHAPTMPGPVSWPVTEFVLVASRSSPAGARYEAIGRWPLLG
jgi:RNA 2',3'-cyclic 3'-phosphodiesterase